MWVTENLSLSLCVCVCNMKWHDDEKKPSYMCVCFACVCCNICLNGKQWMTSLGLFKRLKSLIFACDFAKHIYPLTFYTSLFGSLALVSFSIWCVWYVTLLFFFALGESN